MYCGVYFYSKTDISLCDILPCRDKPVHFSHVSLKFKFLLGGWSDGARDDGAVRDTTAFRL